MLPVRLLPLLTWLSIVGWSALDYCSTTADLSSVDWSSLSALLTIGRQGLATVLYAPLIVLMLVQRDTSRLVRVGGAVTLAYAALFGALHLCWVGFALLWGGFYFAMVSKPWLLMAWLLAFMAPLWIPCWLWLLSVRCPELTRPAPVPFATAVSASLLLPALGSTLDGAWGTTDRTSFSASYVYTLSPATWLWLPLIVLPWTVLLVRLVQIRESRPHWTQRAALEGLALSLCAALLRATAWHRLGLYDEQVDPPYFLARWDEGGVLVMWALLLGATIWWTPSDETSLRASGSQR